MNQNNLVEIKNNQIVTSTLQVAQSFNKEHRNVMRDVDSIMARGVLKNEQTPMFMESTYEHPQNHQKYRIYYMTKDGFSLLVMGFTGKKAMEFKLAFINQFNQMEYQLANAQKDSYMIDDPVKRAERWIEEAKERKELAEQNEIMKPKAIFADAVSVSKTSILVGELAKLLKQNGIDIGAQRLFKWMRENGYLIKRKGNDYNTPTQRSMEMKLFKVKETTINHASGNVTISKTTKVTGRGQIYFINKFKNMNKPRTA